MPMFFFQMQLIRNGGRFFSVMSCLTTSQLVGGSIPEVAIGAKVFNQLTVAIAAREMDITRKLLFACTSSLQSKLARAMGSWRTSAWSYGRFRKLGVPYFGVLRIRILLFRVPYLGPLFSETPIWSWPSGLRKDHRSERRVG